MKIYFTGCHGSGKSTLARYVSETYKLPMVTETARMILSEQELQIDKLRYDLEAVNRYQQQVFERQLIEEQKYTSFVSDRCLLDVLAYSAQHSNILPKLLKTPELTTYVAALRAHDSILFFVRPSKATMKPDGVRESLSWEAAISIDAMLKLLYEMFEVPYFQIPVENMQERVRIVSNILSIHKP